MNGLAMRTLIGGLVQVFAFELFFTIERNVPNGRGLKIHYLITCAMRNVALVRVIPSSRFSTPLDRGKLVPLLNPANAILAQSLCCLSHAQTENLLDINGQVDVVLVASNSALHLIVLLTLGIAVQDNVG